MVSTSKGALRASICLDESVVDPGRGEAQHLGLGVDLLDRRVALREQRRVEFLGTLPEEDVRLVPDFPLVDVALVMLDELSQEGHVIVDAFDGVRPGPGRPVADDGVDGDAVPFGTGQQVVVEGPIEAASPGLDARPGEILAGPFDSGVACHVCGAFHLRARAITSQVDAHAERRLRPQRAVAARDMGASQYA